CRDAAVKMIVGRKSLSFSSQTDSAIISSIIGNYSGLTANVTSTSTTWPEQIQYYVTDWDFILARAEANGMIVTVINGTVSVIKPDADTTSVLTVGYGDGLMEFNADMNSITQLGSVTASTWDYKNQVVSTGQASNTVAGPGNISSDTLSQVVGLSTYQLQTSAALETADLTNWSAAQMIKSEFSKIQGTAKFQGTSLVDLAKYITLDGLGDRFNGDYLISGVVHDISNGNWLTEISVGLSPMWFTEEPDVVAPPASGLLPGARGLFNGTVKQMYNDPDSQYRILVDVPLFDQNGAGIWARLSNFYSTNGAGAFFLPEVGDEVVLGFLNEDPRYPIILGSMYSSTKLKPFNGLDPNQNNTTKAIVSKSGISVQFDDENIVFTIATPNKNTMILSDKDKKITIQDQNSNTITMSSDGITMQSSKTITIDAGQNLVLKGAQGVSVQSSGGDVQTSGMNIKETAQSQYSAEGSLTAQVQGGTELTLKGAMVMIN
ncbi:MAG TPA: type VI secretion system tip protein VgrG, partial [Bacteroidia bacterium]|nr:type VI secretion system tip protein VgrG [Bacteroidia bacterium]